MNIQRFHAPTSRQALAKARMAFGAGTLILSNRPAAGGVEVLASAEELLAGIDGDGGGDGETARQAARAAAAAQTPAPDRAAPHAAAQGAQAASLRHSPVEQDTQRLAMSTLSFQDYVRERMLRRRHPEVLPDPDPDPGPGPGPAQRSHAAAAAHPPQALRTDEARAHRDERLPAQPAARAAQHAPAPAPQTPPAQVRPQPALALQGVGAVSSALQAMQTLIEERLDTLAWLTQARQSTIASTLMLKLLRAAYSPALARALLERLPPTLAPAAAVRWLLAALAHNLRTDCAGPALHEQGGVFALVGATGVGKTSSAARLAALCARSHGAAAVALIALDCGAAPAALQPLREAGRALGIAAHPVQDRAALHDLLGLLAGKKLVLIDTPGLAARDPRRPELLALLDLPPVQRLLVLDAGAHGATQDQVLSAFGGATDQAGRGAQVLLSKTDEAVKLGPALDALIRHRAVLRGTSCGQCLLAHWQRADAQQLVAASMRAPERSACDPQACDLNYFFAHAGAAASAVAAAFGSH